MIRKLKSGGYRLYSRHDLAVSELARQHHRLLTRRGVARQVHPF